MGNLKEIIHYKDTGVYVRIYWIKLAQSMIQ
jgi:hypothetical protein